MKICSIQYLFIKKKNIKFKQKIKLHMDIRKYYCKRQHETNMYVIINTKCMWLEHICICWRKYALTLNGVIDDTSQFTVNIDPKET